MSIIVPEITRESFGASEKRTSLKSGPKSYRESRETVARTAALKRQVIKNIPNSRPRFHRAQNLILAQTGEKNHILLRASVCEYRKPGASCEIFNFFIFCLNKPFSELFSKIQLKVPKALYSLGASVISCDFCERSKPPI